MVNDELAAQIAELREIVGRMTPGERRSERRLRESVVLQSGGKQDGYANRVVCLPQWTPAPYPQPTPDDAFANAAGIVALRNTALPIIDAQAAEIEALKAERDEARAEVARLAMGAEYGRVLAAERDALAAENAHQRWVLTTIRDTFQRDIDRGYVTKDKTYAIEMATLGLRPPGT